MPRKRTAQARVVKPSAPLSVATINRPVLKGLAHCVEDARKAGLDSDPGPAEPNRFHELRGRLEAVRREFPPLYRDSVSEPFIKTLDKLGESQFSRILVRDPERESGGGLMMDIAQAALQQGESFLKTATDAFQEVVSDLYDGFLSAEDRRGVKPPDRGIVPPLVKWGNPDFGPYTWPVDATTSFGLSAAIVNMPPANARAGLVAWSALAHEAAGHDILHADEGLQPELAQALWDALKPLGSNLHDYWSSRIDETSSDVMGILNMGPAAGIGLIAYFRGLGAAFGGQPELRNVGPTGDGHPADIVRGFLAAEVVARLDFTGHTFWSKAIHAETDRDLGRIVLGGIEIPAALARKSASTVAETLVTYKARTLENHALGEIQNWLDRDERKVFALRKALRTAAQPPASVLKNAYAAHAVAAAVLEGLSGESQISDIFARMIAVLKAMHDKNPSWGPLFVRHPGNLSRHPLYVPQPPAVSPANDFEQD